MYYSNNASISFAYFSSCHTPPRKYAILENRNIHFDKMSFVDFRPNSAFIRFICVIRVPFIKPNGNS